jgi:multisubunit Na+/H+ antiporter MnhC subunit
VAYSRPKQNTIVIYLCLLLLAVTGTYQLVSDSITKTSAKLGIARVGVEVIVVFNALKAASASSFQQN